MRSLLAGWLGGKSRLSKKIIARIPEHVCYVEPFAGAAWVLFGKEPSKVEVLNDINMEIVTLYRVVQYHLDEFVRYFRWALVSRNEFERLKRMAPESLTDIQRAARFYYLQQSCFGGRITSPVFGTSTTAAPRLNLLRIEEYLSAAHLRLAGVCLECMGYTELIKKYDRPNTFFYLDPPYWGCENDYGKNIFGKDDFSRLAGVLRGLEGKFLLSLNDVPEIRVMFQGFKLEPVDLFYSCGVGNSTPARELFISNY